MNRILTTAVVATAQAMLIGVAVAPQVWARTTGDTYVVRVAPVDPIDPYRGAYVALKYPDLHARGGRLRASGLKREDDGINHPVYITLRQEGEVWVADEIGRTRPDEQPYLACASTWTISCGIESWFLPQDEALRMERDLAKGGYAELKVDGRGHAALVDVRADVG